MNQSPPKSSVSLTLRASALRRWCLGLTLGASLLLGCSESRQDPITSSQTHWLEACESSSECGDLECACGVCTKACTSTQSCGAAADDVICAPTDAVASCGAGAPAQVCLPGCEEDEDCADDASCDDGVCVAGAAPSPDASTPITPPGLRCGDYPACDVETPCASGSCLAFAECTGGICVPDGEACELSCPDPDTCVYLDSYPGQLRCDDQVPAIPAEPEPLPAGVDCGDYVACDALSPCSDTDCVYFDGCESGVCIATATACELTCPDPESCAIAESYPLQLFCPGAVDAHGGPPIAPDTNVDGGTAVTPDAASPTSPPGVDCSAHPVCDVNGPGCASGQNCIALVGCEQPTCIPSEEACELSCPDPDECAIAESYPEQLSCPGRVDAYYSQGAVDGGAPASDAGTAGTACGNTTCGPEERCCDACESACVSLFAELLCPDDEAPSPCTPRPFECGDRTCDAAQTYCQIEPTDIDDAGFSCEPLPAACQPTASCECLGDAGFVDNCSATDGALTVTL